MLKLLDNRYSKDSSFNLLYNCFNLSKKLGYTKGTCLASISMALYQELFMGPRDSVMYYNAKALALAKQLKNAELTARAYINTGVMVVAFYYNSKKALAYYDSALQVVQNRNLKIVEAQALFRKAETLITFKQFSQAKSILFRATDLVVSAGMKPDRNLMATVGSLYLETGQYDSALVMFKQVLELVKGNARWESYMYSLLAKAYDGAGNLEAAIGNAQAGLSIAKDEGLGKERIDNLEAFYSIYKRNNDFKNALHYFELFKQFNDSLNQSTLDGNNARYESELQAERTQHQNLLLKKENEVQAQNSKWQKLIILFSLGGLIIVILFSLSAIRRARIMKRQNLIIEAKQKEILDSIHYAKRIQTALLSSYSYIEKSLNRLKNK